MPSFYERQAHGFSQSPGRKKIAISLPNALFDEIAEIAFNSRRSTASTILLLIEKALKDD